MKILMTTDAYLPMVNGVTTSIRTLKTELQALGHEVRVLTLSHSGEGYMEDNTYYLPAHSAQQFYPGAMVSFCLAHPYLDELAAWQPDLVHSQTEFSSLRFALRLAQEAGVPLVQSYHTLYEDYTHYFSPSRRAGRQLVATASRRVLNRMDCVVAPTAKVKRRLESYGVERPIFIAPTGIYLEKFRPVLTGQNRQALRRRMGAGEGEPLLLALGRVAKEKSIDQLVAYMAQLGPAPVHLAVVGDGPARQELEEAVAAMGLAHRVTFTGMVSPDQVPLYYQAADVFVCASHSETQGLTYLEALASGLPLLCSRDDCLEGVLQNGVNGFAFDNFSQFAQGLQALSQSPAAREGFARQALASAQQFSAQTFGRRMERLYYSLAATAQPVGARSFSFEEVC